MEWNEANKERRRWSLIQKSYGLTEADFNSMLVEQGGCCKICGTTRPGGRFNTNFHVDHCHSSGKVRGLLCARCNKMLGSVEDDITILTRAIIYLQNAQKSQTPN